MLKVRLARTGKRGQATYRIVVMEARTSRQGKVTDTIGWYNPGLKENNLSIDKVKYAEWIAKGAQPTISVLRLVLTKEEKIKMWPDIKKAKAAVVEEAKAEPAPEKKAEPAEEVAPVVEETAPEATEEAK